MTTIYFFSSLLFGALILNLLLAAIKTGFTNARLPRVLTLGEQLNRQTAETIALLNQRPRLGTRLQISHVILRFLLAGFVIGVFIPWPAGELRVLTAIIVLIFTAIVLSFFEQFIENRVLHEPEIWALRLTKFTRVFLSLLSPFLALPILISRLISPEPKRFYSVTEDELQRLLDAGQAEGVLEGDEREMLKSVFQFRNTLVREIMVPRIDVLAFRVSTPILQAVDAMLKSGYSRVPVYQDNIDSVIGILYVKDLLHYCREGFFDGTLQDKLRPVYFVPETKKVDELLTDMQERRTHIAMVVDEFGGVAGLVTLEDIVEELVGEIQDEFDQAEEEIYQQVNDSEYIFQARIDLDDFNEIMDCELIKEDADTLGGLIYSRVGRVPKSGEVIQTDDILLTVEQVIGRRIRKVRAQRTPKLLENSKANTNVDG